MTYQQQLPLGRRPTHRLFRVIGGGKSAIWTPIGAAWPNKDGLGFNISCDLVPLQGRIVLRAVASGEIETPGGSAMTPSPQTVAMRTLNDEFRRSGPILGRNRFDGLWLFSHGVQAQGIRFLWQALSETQRFDAFNANNDPHGQHDFGAFDLDGEEVFWTIVYLERGQPSGAGDPTDNRRTCRVITIMLAEEY